MESILKHDDDDTEDVHLEADFFETITKSVLFSGHNTTHRRIYIENLHNYGSSYAKDEDLYYMLVPQKRAAPLMFTLDLQERQQDGTYKNIDHTKNPEVNKLDELLIYTKAFSFYDDYFESDSDVYDEMEKLAWEGEVASVRQETWSANGRVMGFRTLDNDETGTERYGLHQNGSYNIYMLTNSSDNKDVVRVASNKTSNPYVFANDRDGKAYTGNYQGNEYRSAIFDVAHYRPFRFAAQVEIYEKDDKSDREIIPSDADLLSNEIHGSQEEDISEVLLSYKPGQKVDILLDVTSFRGSDGRSVHPFGQIFGEEFEVYIDAPMLEIDQERLPSSWKASNKLRKDPEKTGRFIYTVSQKRADEREFGFAPAHNKDDSNARFDDYGGVVPKDKWLQYQNTNGGNLIKADGSLNQDGERKCLPFKKTAITSKGDITIIFNYSSSP